MTRLRVAIDARRLQDRPLGGVGRALAGMLDLLAPEVDVVLLTDARRPPAPCAHEQHALRPLPGVPETTWLQHDVPRWLRNFDGVFHGTFNQLPFRSRTPAVVTLHDLSFERHPDGFSRAKRIAFQIQARHAARVAGRITTPSEFTKDEVVTTYGVKPDRVIVTPWGVDPRFSPSRSDDAPQLCRRLGIRAPYVVALGGAPRRGLEVAVDAWHRVRDASGRQLAVVGPEGVEARPGLVHVGALHDDDWPALLAGADIFCYPTRYEGFGFPALESIASGTPVVCAPVGSLPEVLGDAAVWCDAPTVDAVAEGLRDALLDADRIRDLSRRGLMRAAERPGWEHTADLTLRAYREAYDAGGP